MVLCIAELHLWFGTAQPCALICLVCAVFVVLRGGLYVKTWLVQSWKGASCWHGRVTVCAVGGIEHCLLLAVACGHQRPSSTPVSLVLGQ